ncbi:unnamed protein product [Didymodactylos carnosus]|uniref:Uncharacterized protein n=1 Tax=Didymodactylos carnosus TaxID=1234261 RepID=A0A815VMG6_9BILA|nr:unnamed protein product [Didymodactylos carnosus]CAF4391562.1 unnamed protein product [Didymodactylos carnosus]
MLPIHRIILPLGFLLINISIVLSIILAGHKARYKETAKRMLKLNGHDVVKSDIVKKELSILINDILLECYLRPSNNTFAGNNKKKLVADSTLKVHATINYSKAFPTAILTLYNDPDQPHIVYNAIFTLIGFIDITLSKYKIQKQFVTDSDCKDSNLVPPVPDLYGPNSSLENVDEYIIQLWRGWMLTCLELQWTVERYCRVTPLITYFKPKRKKPLLNGHIKTANTLSNKAWSEWNFID